MCASKPCVACWKRLRQDGVQQQVPLLAGLTKEAVGTCSQPSRLPDVVTTSSKGLLPADGAAVGIHQVAEKFPAYKQTGTF